MRPPFILLLTALSFSTFAQTLEIPLITVRGSGVVFANPYEILVSLSLRNQDMDLVKTRSDHKVQSKQVISFLKKMGIAERHIQTQRSFIGPKWHHKTRKLEYYYATQTINVCVRDLEKYDAIIDGLVDMEVAQIGSPNYRSDIIDEKRSEALRLAMRDAKAKASLMVEELGQTIGKAKLISEYQTKRTTHNAETYGSSVVKSPATTVGAAQAFSPGQMEIKSSVTVSFELP